MIKFSKEKSKQVLHTEAAFLQHMHEIYGIAYIFANGKAIGCELETID